MRGESAPPPPLLPPALGGGVTTTNAVLVVLLLLTGSVEVVDTVATRLPVPAFASCNVTVMVTEAPAARLPRLQLTVAAAVHVPPVALVVAAVAVAKLGT